MTGHTRIVYAAYAERYQSVRQATIFIQPQIMEKVLCAKGASINIVDTRLMQNVNGLTLSTKHQDFASYQNQR